MNIYYITSIISALANLTLAIVFIFYLDILKYNDLMFKYFVLYLLTMLIAICLYKIGNEHDFNLRIKRNREKFENDNI
tara:strand:- start:351 stop:584 length:234 start_codon:yes stop_codon:yes gene_type:complete